VSKPLTPEQEARDLLDRMWVDDAQDWSAGDVAELANILARLAEAERLLREVDSLVMFTTGQKVIGGTLGARIKDAAMGEGRER